MTGGASRQGRAAFSREMLHSAQVYAYEPKTAKNSESDDFTCLTVRRFPAIM